MAEDTIDVGKHSFKPILNGSWVIQEYVSCDIMVTKCPKSRYQGQLFTRGNTIRHIVIHQTHVLQLAC